MSVFSGVIPTVVSPMAMLSYGAWQTSQNYHQPPLRLRWSNRPLNLAPRTLYRISSESAATLNSVPLLYSPPARSEAVNSAFIVNVRSRRRAAQNNVSISQNLIRPLARRKTDPRPLLRLSSLVRNEPSGAGYIPRKIGTSTFEYV